MKNKILLNLFICLFCTISSYAQDSTFKVSVSSAEVLMENYFEVKFSLSNASGSNFSPPNFKEFDIVSGPNQSSSYSMINGAVDQSVTYSYYLSPKETGNFYIEAASIETEDEIMETAPLEIVVLPNPEGIKKDIPQEDNLNMDSFFNFNFDFGEPRKEQTKPKKKRKVYKL